MEYFQTRLSVSVRERKYETPDSKSETEQAGYIPPKQQIEQMILAGRRLDDFRKEQFDFDSEEEIDEELYDPTRSVNFDLADATQMQIAVKQSLTEQAVTASKTAQEPLQATVAKKIGETTPEPEKGA